MGPLRQIPGARRRTPGHRPAKPYAGGATRAPTAPRPPDCSAGRPGSAVLHFLELAKHGQGVALMGQLRMGLGYQEDAAPLGFVALIDPALINPSSWSRYRDPGWCGTRSGVPGEIGRRLWWVDRELPREFGGLSASLEVACGEEENQWEGIVPADASRGRRGFWRPRAGEPGLLESRGRWGG